MPPTAKQIRELKKLAAGIIRAQGNRFIKELLREKKIRIGTKKADFERNLNEAIESGQLRLEDADEWLQRVEGWGNQHVYLYSILPALKKELTVPKIKRKARSAGLENVWDGETVMAFPDEPELTSISFDGIVLRLVWQESSPGWTAVPDRNYSEEDGLDTFEYRAYRKVAYRAVTRFEAHLDKGLAGLFIANPITGEEHKTAIREANKVIGQLMDLTALKRGLINISTVTRNLDHGNIPSKPTPDPEIKTQRSKLRSGGATVEFASMSGNRAYWEEPAIQDLRMAIRDGQIESFNGTGGVFIFQEGVGDPSLTRPLRVQLYGDRNRIRLWAQMDVDEVWTILAKVSDYQ